MTATPLAAYRAFPSPIPVAARRLWHVPTCQMARGKENEALWIARLDQLVSARLDRRILVHTASYQRVRRYLGATRFRKGNGLAGVALLSHEPGGNAEWAVAELRRTAPPVVLLSPAMARGIDLPNEDCRALFVIKTPFPVPTALVRARTALQPDYPMEEAAGALQQLVGRAARHEGDWAECLILDDDAKWFIPRRVEDRKHKYRGYFTDAFLEAWAGTWPGVGLPPPPDLATGPVGL